MSSIADLLNSAWDFMNERAKKSSDAARAVTGITDQDGVLDIAKKTANSGFVPEMQKEAGVFVPSLARSVVAAPTTLYSLGSAATNAATGGNFVQSLATGEKTGAWSWPGAEGAADFTATVSKPFNEVSDAIMGRRVDDKLLSGTPEELAGAWSRMILSAGATLPMALPKVTSGVKIVEEAGNAAIKAAEILTPITIAKTPTAALVNTNVAVGAGIGAGLEHVIEGSIPKQAVAKAAQENSDFTKGAQDVATQGVEEAKRANPVIAGMPAKNSGMSAEEYALGGAIAGAAALAYWKRGVARRALTGLADDETTVVSKLGQLAAQLTDRNAPINETYREGLKKSNIPNYTAEADAFESRLAARTGASTPTKLRNTYEFGELPDSNIKIEPLNDLFTKVRNLTPAQKEAAETWINYRHEANVRQRILNSDPNIAANVGRVGTPQADHLFTNITRMRGVTDDKIAYNMWDVSSQDIMRHLATPIADQAVQDVVNTYTNIMRQMPKYLYEQRALTKNEAVALQRMNPHYVATELAAGRTHLSEMNPKAMQGALKPGSAFEELPNYVEQMVRFVETNKVRRDFIGRMIQLADNGNAYAKSLFGRRDLGLQSSVKSSDRTVQYRDHLGRARDIEVNDPIVRRALQNINRPAALTAISGSNAAMKGLTGAARFFENAAVGPLGAITGSVFAPIGAAYNTISGTTFRQKGMAAGWADKLVQDMTGGKFGIKGDWVTMLPDALLIRAPQGVLAVMAQRASRALQNSLMSGGYAAKYLPPQTAQAVADGMANHFKRSWVYKLQQDGQMGPASYMSIDPAKRFQDAAAMIKDAGPLGQYGGVISDILHAISASPAASLYAMNKNKNAKEVSRFVRDFAGDPSRSGAFDSKAANVVGNAAAMTPWGNIFLQSWSKMIRSFKKDPTGTVGGIVNSVGMPTILGGIYVASMGPEYTDYMYNVRSPDRQASSWYIPLPGKPPEQGLEVPVAPELRPFKHGIELLVGIQLGLLDGTIFKPGNEGFLNSLNHFIGVDSGKYDYANASDMVKHRQFGGPTTEGSVLSSVAQQSILPPAPVAMNVAWALAGQKLRSPIDASPIREGRHGFTDAQGKSPLRDWEHPQTEEVIAALGADSARFIYNTLADTMAGINQGQGVGDSTSRIVDAYGQRLKDGSKYMSGALFSNLMSISPAMEAAGKVTKSKLDGMEEFLKAYNDATDKGVPLGDLAGSKQQGYRSVLGQGPVGPDMLQMQVGEHLRRLHPALSKEFLSLNKTLYDERSRILNEINLPPEKKRALANEVAVEIIQNDRKMLEQIQRLEQSMSKSLGVDIKFDKLKPGKPIAEPN